MKMLKENAILSEIAKDKRLNEDSRNPGKYFQLLQDMENIDIKAWNATNDQAARDAMVRPFLQEFWDKYKEEMDESDIEALFDDMEDSNYHTEYRVLDRYEKNKHGQSNKYYKLECLKCGSIKEYMQCEIGKHDCKDCVQDFLFNIGDVVDNGNMKCKILNREYIKIKNRKWRS